MLAAAALSACVVVPIDPATGQPYPYPYAQPVPAPAASPPQVVFVQPNAAQPSGVSAVNAPGLVNARLYPANETARAVGLLNATVLDNGQGRGTFNVIYGNTALQGEATRVDRGYPGFGQVLARVQGGAANWSNAQGQRGIANAAGGNASLRCEYLFTSATQGTGACVGSDGAHYQIHFGS
jgi:hypothetical protein